jgi:hypothetical protein
MRRYFRLFVLKVPIVTSQGVLMRIRKTRLMTLSQHIDQLTLCRGFETYFRKVALQSGIFGGVTFSRSNLDPWWFTPPLNARLRSLRQRAVHAANANGKRESWKSKLDEIAEDFPSLVFQGLAYLAAISSPPSNRPALPSAPSISQAPPGSPLAWRYR